MWPNIKEPQIKDISLFRYERKYFISDFSKSQVEMVVKNHPSIFKEIFYERIINNIYFDTLERNNYVDNIEGSKDRVKFRIRWYGDLEGKILKPKLEMKIKIGLLGAKRTFKLQPFCFDEKLSRADLQDVFRKSDLPDDVMTLILQQWPALVNQYRRKYFQSMDKKFRITIDDKQKFLAIRSFGNTFLSGFKDDSNIILELKYDQQYFMDAEVVSNCFPFRVTKSSKYARGIYGTSGIQMG